MQIYLAGHGGIFDQLVLDDGYEPPYMMASYYYMGGETDGEYWKLDYRETDACNGFLVDSGAFSFLTNNRAADGVDFDAYLDKYIDFINEYDIQRFFELDIDSVVGTAKVREYRDRLERKTARACIPVWHPERGKDAFIRLCETYDYIALGGIYDEISPKWFEYFPWFIEQAHNEGTRIHGLGFTPTKDMQTYRFDSVDSSSWVFSSNKGKVYRFDSADGTPHLRLETKDERIDYKKVWRYNLRAWIRYANYADGRHGPDAALATSDSAASPAERDDTDTDAADDDGSDETTVDAA